MQTFDLTKGVNQFYFPDGQPHLSAPYLFGNNEVNIRTRICNGDDLFRVLLAADAVRRAGATKVDLTVLYLMAARMDRPMPIQFSDLGFGWIDSYYHPFSLKVVADALRTGNFNKISVLDPHSDVATALLDATPIIPKHAIRQAYIRANQWDSTVVLVAPDAGAAKKVSGHAEELGAAMVQCMKKRNMATGKLSDFALENLPTGYLQGTTCLIVDDICDGGRTFTGVSDCLRSAGAGRVELYVTHGIFSNGLPISGVDHIYTTESYQELESTDYLTVMETKC